MSKGWIRYGFIVVPAIVSLLYIDKPLLSFYTAQLLALLALAQWNSKWASASTKAPLLIIETIGAGWIAWTYDGVTFTLLFSTMLEWSRLNKSFERWGGWMLCFAALNLALAGQIVELWLSVGLLYLGFAVLLESHRSISASRLELQQLNDHLRRQQGELTEQRNRTIDYSRTVERLAQIEERNRISHELHDELGHQLVRIKMMMEAALSIQSTQPERGRALLEQVRDQLAEGMETLRRTVRKLKPSEDSVKQYSLSGLIEGLAKEQGIRIRLLTAGMPYPLYPSEEIVLYRNAQEAVTNAWRHGKATEVDIQLFYAEHQVRMSVRNNGAIPAGAPKKGLGLVGMEERTHLFGGTVLIEQGPPFTVTTILPRKSSGEYSA
jgi:two-component system, NarL family, sensor kinase